MTALARAARGLEHLHGQVFGSADAAPVEARYAGLRWILYAVLAERLAGVPAGVFGILAGPGAAVLERTPPDTAEVAAEVGGALARDGELDWAGDVGALHEGLLGLVPELDAGALRLSARRHSARRATGAFYTPTALVEQVLETGLAPQLRRARARGEDPLALRVADPACGAGVFLVAAARRIAAALAPSGRRGAAAVMAGCLRGADRDGQAVALARVALWIEGGGGVPAGRLVATVVAGDTLRRTLLPAATFDAVLGNPPFLGQLSRATALGSDERAALRARFGDALRPYTDPGALFLLAALDLARTGGRVALVQSQSVVAVRDAERVRAGVTGRGALDHLWTEEQPVFDAGARVCVLTLVKGTPQGEVRRATGLPARPLAPVALPAGSWAPLLADRFGVPEVHLRGRGSVGDVARVTADFRDQYYGLVPHVHEREQLGSRGIPLVTSGLVDPARCWWAERPARFARRRFAAPAVDAAAVSAGPLGAWLRARLVPKVLVATQTRVLEAVVDRAGGWVPSVPLLSLTAAPGELDRLAALLCSPVVTAWALRRHGGSAMSPDALKLSASQVGGVPLPGDAGRWTEAGTAFAAAQDSDDGDAVVEALRESGAKVHEAFGLGATDSRVLLEWWVARLPRALRPPASGTPPGRAGAMIPE